jgi:ubiquinone/menaquinone biosynthesis C-methylase UbiE
MNHTDHVNLLRRGIRKPGGDWADLGSGWGAFTLALAELIGPEGTIYSVDKNRGDLRVQERNMRDRFGERSPSVHYLNGDFTRPLDLPQLDGLVMANALHFVQPKKTVLAGLLRYLKPRGRFILVEYNVDRGNIWVPYPLSYPAWETLAGEVGLSETRLLYTRPSRFLREIYSALSFYGDSE